MIDFGLTPKAANLVAALETMAEPVEQSLAAYQTHLAEYVSSHPMLLEAADQAIRPWIKVLPGLRFLGFSPCWNADCPLCGAARSMWVTALEAPMLRKHFGDGSGWFCDACNAEGLDTKSLTKAIAALVSD